MDNRQIVLSELPHGRLGPQHFALRTGERPSAGEGEAVVKVLYVSLDAANRAWMQGATYRSALKAGDVTLRFYEPFDFVARIDSEIRAGRI